MSLMSPALASRFFTASATWKGPFPLDAPQGVGHRDIQVVVQELKTTQPPPQQKVLPSRAVLAKPRVSFCLTLKRIAVAPFLKVAWLLSRMHFPFPQGVNHNMIWGDREKSEEQSQNLAESRHKLSGNQGLTCVYSGGRPRTQVGKVTSGCVCVCFLKCSMQDLSSQTRD